MTHMQFIPGDPRLVDQLVYELKSRGIFDQVSIIKIVLNVYFAILISLHQ